MIYFILFLVLFRSSGLVAEGQDEEVYRTVDVPALSSSQQVDALRNGCTVTARGYTITPGAPLLHVHHYSGYTFTPGHGDRPLTGHGACGLINYVTVNRHIGWI